MKNYTRTEKYYQKWIEEANQIKRHGKSVTMAGIGAPNPTPLIAGEHIFLTAVSHGLSACFIGYLDTEKASEILKLPEHISCLFLLPVGYAAEPVEPKPKKSIAEISFADTWRGMEKEFSNGRANIL